jgi:hypothetical protein
MPSWPVYCAHGEGKERHKHTVGVERVEQGWSLGIRVVPKLPEHFSRTFDFYRKIPCQLPHLTCMDVEFTLCDHIQPWYIIVFPGDESV